jgi:hypothetical protein
VGFASLLGSKVFCWIAIERYLQWEGRRPVDHESSKVDFGTRRSGGVRLLETSKVGLGLVPARHGISLQILNSGSLSLQRQGEQLGLFSGANLTLSVILLTEERSVRCMPLLQSTIVFNRGPNMRH